MPNLHERCGLIWQWFFSSWVFFCANFIFWDMFFSKRSPPIFFLAKWANFFFKSGRNYMKDAECAETNKNSIFRLLVFDIWPFLYSRLPNFRWTFTITLTTDESLLTTFISTKTFYDQIWNIYVRFVKSLNFSNLENFGDSWGENDAPWKVDHGNQLCLKWYFDHKAVRSNLTELFF